MCCSVLSEVLAGSCAARMRQGRDGRAQVRTLVDVPGEKLPSAATGALQDYLRSTIAPQVGAPCRTSSGCRGFWIELRMRHLNRHHLVVKLDCAEPWRSGYAD